MNVFGEYDKKMTGLELSVGAEKSTKRQFYLPEELVLQIFGFLNGLDRYKQGCVSKRWLNMTKNPNLHDHRFSLKTSDEYTAALTEIFLERSLSAFRKYVYEDDLKGTFKVEKIDNAISMFVGSAIYSPHFTVHEVIHRKVQVNLWSGIISKVTSDIKETICKKRIDLEALTSRLEWKYRCRYWNYFLSKYEIKIFKNGNLDQASKVILNKCLDKLNQRLMKKPILLCKVQQYIPMQELLDYYMD